MIENDVSYHSEMVGELESENSVIKRFLHDNFSLQPQVSRLRKGYEY